VLRPAGEKPRRARLVEGEVEFVRAVFECPRCRHSVAPLDLELGLGGHETLSHQVQKKVAYAAAQTSFGQASLDLAHQVGIEVSPAEVARIAKQVGAALEACQREREVGWNEPISGDHRVAPPERRCERLVIEADATSALTVKGEEHKMIYVGTAFEASQRGVKDASGRPYVAERRYGASAEDFEDFGARLRALAHRMGVRGAREVAFLGDGALCQWKWAEENLPGAALIQDLWHVLDRLSTLLHDLGGRRSEELCEQLERWKEKLLASRVQEVLDELRTWHRRSRRKARRRLAEEIRYLETSRPRMDYARYRAAGWPIGSGAIEGGCKHLVKERFGRTGARWKRARLRYVLALRLSLFNDEWETDWATALRPAA
jgi:hypothetical protein